MTKFNHKPTSFLSVDVYGNLYYLSFYRTRYLDGNLCICCNSSQNGIVYEPYLTITKDVPSFSTKTGNWCVLDWNKCPKLLTEMLWMNIFTDHGHRLRSGFCEYPLVEIDEIWLNNLPMKGE